MSAKELTGRPLSPEPVSPYSPAHLRRWLLALLLLGLAWRWTRYLLCFPIWGDEAANCLNLIGQDYRSILGPLRCKQVAPLLFWWGELTAFRWLGPSELALRLLPFLAGLGGLLLVWRLAHLTLAPLPRTFAVGILAVATCPVSMGTLLKPYALDLLMAAALLVLAVQWLQRPERSGWLLALVLLAPVSLGTSFPAIFVAGSISVALLPAVWRQPGWKPRVLFATYNLLVVASFLGILLAGEAQLGPSDTTFRQFLKDYWAHGFPPRAPLAFVKWLILTHTGRLMAYPVGGSNGLSALTLLLFLVGAWHLWRRRQRALLVLCIGPFALGFCAALLHRYPYGGCWRLSQHVVPSICLLAGLGTAVLIERVRSASLQKRWITAVFALLAFIGLCGTGADIVHPYRGDTDVWMRQLAQQLDALSSSGDQVVVLNAEESTDAVFLWYLSRFRGQVSWKGKLDGNRVNKRTSQVWCLNFQLGWQRDQERLNGVNDPPGLQHVKEQLGRTWILSSHIPYTIIPARKCSPVVRCDVYRWVNAAGSHGSAHGQLLSCWPHY